MTPRGRQSGEASLGIREHHGMSVQLSDLKRTTLAKSNLKHMVRIGNVHEKIWEWMAISTRYLYAPPLQCRRSRILGPALAQTVSLGPDIEGAHSTLKGRADFAGAC